ncbi:MAG: hypothetical protein HOE30_01010 [Deltaproteobacteria bacterium]|nr:hypothetical protein [Deltaproteobacteria bacterium]MBT4268614.1 hypothetical protein [Deltaproteobacteria bacterium]MBT4642715.1 hypothetical protein [Deltaproteobacteria bacterium]MBT6501981.1 hypothetical protein [Deltaproteobacteria bacterium]MBT6611782.1 hypothetical protein [Deltaproteobacteria bacterium]
MTTNEDVYDKLRILLSPNGFIYLPQHEETTKLLTNLYTEEEANLLVTCFPKFREVVSLDKMGELTGLPKAQLSEMLSDMAYKGKITPEGKDEYFLLAYLPGVFEEYFTANRDDPEIMKKVAEPHHALHKMGFSPETEWPLKSTPDFNPKSGWRFVPAVEPVTRTLAINESVDAANKVLPFEAIEQYWGEFDVFSVTMCSCRNVADLAGDPCKRTSENFCAQAGPVAEHMIASGVGKKLNFDEMMALMKKAAEAGLVHSTMNMQNAAGFI